MTASATATHPPAIFLFLNKSAIFFFIFFTHLSDFFDDLAYLGTALWQNKNRLYNYKRLPQIKNITFLYIHSKITSLNRNLMRQPAVIVFYTLDPWLCVPAFQQVCLFCFTYTVYSNASCLSTSFFYFFNFYWSFFFLFFINLLY